MELVVCCALMLAVAAVLTVNIIYFKKAFDCVRQNKPAGTVCKRLRVLFGAFLALWLMSGILIPHLLGGPYGFTQPILQTVFSGIGGYWVINQLQKSGTAH